MKPEHIRVTLNRLNDPAGLPPRVLDRETGMVAEWSDGDRAYKYPDGTYTYAFVVRDDRKKFQKNRRFTAAPAVQKELNL